MDSIILMKRISHVIGVGNSISRASGPCYPVPSGTEPHRRGFQNLSPF
jgi:hypothetical protein